MSSLLSLPGAERRSGRGCGPFSAAQISPPRRSRKGRPAPTFLSPSLCLWLLFEALALLVLILFPFRNVECLNLLLSSGADLRRRDKFGRCVDVQGQTWGLPGRRAGRAWEGLGDCGGERYTAVPGCSSACLCVCPWLSRHPPSRPPRRTSLHYAAANGSYQCAVTLVTAGAGVNEADCKGCSPLHYAAASDTYRR